MQRIVRLMLASAAAFLVLLIAPGTAMAQGATTGAIGGFVQDSAGNPIPNATVRAASSSTGLTRSAVSGSNGRYVISGLEVDHYKVSATAIGYKPKEEGDVRVTLSNTTQQSFSMEHLAVQLQEIVANAAPSTGDFGTSRTGAQTTVSDTMIRRLPTLNRQLEDFIRLTPEITTTPQASGGTTGQAISIAGQNNRFNSIQVDGTDQQDRFGLGNTGELGGQASGRGISLEAVKEFDVVLAPYNVTQGGFTGGLVNAVTKNGTNTVAATAFYTFRNQDIASNVPFIANSQFSIKEFGGSIGGPIIKDKLHFFVAGELNRATKPAAGPYLGQSASITPGPPIDQATFDRFTQILGTYGIPGGSAGLINDQNPITNLVARVDWTLSDKSRMVFRNIYDNAKGDDFSRSASTFSLTSNQFRRAEIDNSNSFQWFHNSTNGGNNEFQLGYIHQNFSRALSYVGPQIRVFSVPVASGSGTYSLIAGADSNSHINGLQQDIYEFHDDYTFPFKGNAAHLVTIGTRSDLYKSVDFFEQNLYGAWSFNGLDSLAAGNAHSYAVGLPRGGVDPAARFKTADLAFYLQDQWTVSPRFNVVYGLRGEAPVFLDKPVHSDSIANHFQRNTEEVPSNWLISPRVGFNYNSADGYTQIRGGIGTFAGIPPYVWMANLFTNNGFGLGQLTCASGSTAGPAPGLTAGEVGPGNNPQECANGAGLNSGQIGVVNTVDPSYKQAENLRATLGMDHKLPMGFVGTIDLTWTKVLEAPFMTNLDLDLAQSSIAVKTDPNGRVMYGTIAANGASTKALKPGVPNIYSGGAYDLENTTHGHAYSAAFSLKKAFSRSIAINASYTYSRSYSVQDFTSSVAASNFNFGWETAGNLLDKTTTAPAAWDQPSHLVAAVTYTAPWKKLPTDISFIYQGFSGIPFTYTYGKVGSASGDLNADGVSGNDPIFIPNTTNIDTTMFVNFTGSVGGGASRNISREEQADSFKSFVNQMSCLQDQQGKLMSRRSCRNPFFSTLDLSVRQSLPSLSGHKLTLEAEIFNFLNFLDGSWGQYRSNGTFQDVFLFTQTAMKADGTPIVRFDPNLANLNTRFPKVVNANNFWQAQLTLRYAF
ncbi:MAG TPA: carboxypeptidase regulatory-like domain-containing protein [Gemmatimonadales bacterium]|jgi:outer membrane receptor for ferrienterochelin and colicin